MFDFGINLNIFIYLGVAILFVTVLSVVGFFFFIAYTKRTKESNILKKSLGLTYFEIRLPMENDVEIKAAEQMFTGLIGIAHKLKGWKKFLGVKNFISFEIVAFKESIRFFVVCPKEIASVVDRQINGTYPAAEISEVKEYSLFPENSSVAYAALTLAKETNIPVQTYEELPVDTIATVCDIFSKLKNHESAAMQLVITPAGSEWRDSAKEYIEKQREPETDEEGKPKKKKNKVDSNALSLIERKIEKAGFYSDIRIVIASESDMLAKSHLANVLSAFDQFTRESGNRFKKVDSKALKNIVKDFIYRIPRETMILNTSELATVFHLPNKNVQITNINWLLAKRSPAAEFIQSNFQSDTMYVGKNNYRGRTKEIFIKPEDRLRHFYVIGQTGTGKSGFMDGMMIRDMKMGHGCGFIDPHGSDAEKILQQVPPERVEDVVFFDPSDIERPFGLNMLEFNTEAQRTLVINELLNIFDTLYDLKKTGGPIFEQYFRYGALLLTEDPESGSTLLDLPKIFADDDYRTYKLSKCKDQEVIDFWEKQALKAGGEASLKNVTPYIVSKLASFLTNAYMRPIIAQQESTLNFREIMDGKKILIAKLSKGKIGEFNANLLGMILIGKILVGALEREEIPEKDRTPFYLYIDEFQNFLTEGINIILSEARKYKLALTIAHQFIGQLTKYGGDTKTRDAIFGNVGNKAVFRIGEDDASFMEKVFDGVFTASDMQKVENGTFFCKMLVDGKPTPPFSARSWYGESPYDMVTEFDSKIADIAKQISRLKYGKDKNIIESEIKMKHLFIQDLVAKSPKPAPAAGGFPGLF
jgi:hypothetical protein